MPASDPDDPGPSLALAVAQVIGRAGEVAGSGFLVAEDLLLTCAHVLEDGGHGPGDLVPLVFPRAPGGPEGTGLVLPGSWRAPDEQDIAVLRLTDPVPGTVPLALGSAVGVREHRLHALGFPQQAPPAGHFGYAVAGHVLPAGDRSGALLQLTDANDLTTGFSGGPLLDELTGLVVGMVSAIAPPDEHGRGTEIAYATPTSELRDAWPELTEQAFSPYRALESFTAEHARWFRGREEAVERVLAGLAGRRRATLLLGPSGAGKSSLVGAGVLPALAAGRLPGSSRWLPVVVRPGLDLDAAMAAAGLTDVGAQGWDAAVARLLDMDAEHDRVLLVVDQFEELLSGPEGAPDPAALDLLTAAVGSTAPLGLLLVMRDDFYSRLSSTAPELLDLLLPSLLNVPAALTRAELTAIVTGPAADLRTPFEPGLADRIVADVLTASPGPGPDRAPATVLPLLEVTLSLLWESRAQHDGRLTHAAYQALGGITGALADWCESALAELDTPGREVARRLLTALVRPADPALDLPASRQQLPLGQLRDLAAGSEDSGTVDRVLTVLTARRIVTTHRGTAPPGTADLDSDEPVAELIHDALIRDWAQLRDWIDQDARFHDWLHRLRSLHRRWLAHPQPQDLPTGSLLAQGLETIRRRRLPTELEEFLLSGLRRQRRALRRTRALAAGLAVLLVLALTASGMAWKQQRAAVQAQHTALSRQLANMSGTLSTTDPDLAVLLAVAAHRTDPTREAAEALNAAAAQPLHQRIDLPLGTVSALAYSPDGSTLATGIGIGPERSSTVGHLQLWDTRSGAPGARLPTDEVDDLAFSPDGRLLASADRAGAARLWDAASGTSLAVLTVPGDHVRSLAFSPDGSLLAAGTFLGTVQLFEVAAASLRAGLAVQKRSVDGLAFSPDGTTLAVSGDGLTVHLWDVPSRTFRRDLQSDGSAALAFSPDGRTLATSIHDDSVALWDTASWSVRAELAGSRPGRLDSLAFSPDGRTLAGGDSDGKVWLWASDSGSPRTVLTGHRSSVASLAFSPDGETLASGGEDRTVRLWSTGANSTHGVVTTLDTPVDSVIYGAGGQTLAIIGNARQSWFPWGGAPGGRILRLWDATDGSILARPERLTSAVVGSDGRTVATSGEGRTDLWAVTDLDPRAAFVDDPNTYVVAVGPDGRTAAMFSTETFFLRDLTSGSALPLTNPDGVSPSRTAFSPDGRFLASTVGGSVRLWDVSTGQSLPPVIGSDVLAFAFSPDGRTLATGTGAGPVQLWDAYTGRLRATLAQRAANVMALAFSPDGTLLAAGGTGPTVGLWNVADGTRRVGFTGHTGGVFVLAFSPDGETLATGGTDRTVRLWDTSAGTARATLTGLVGQVTALGFRPDGQVLATGTTDGAVRLWSTLYAAPEAAARHICSAVNRELSDYEWSTYLPGETPRPLCPEATAAREAGTAPWTVPS
ncbi:nSTAND1 domain-containing NTPase [Kitasatospora sp. NPDC001664]